MSNTDKALAIRHTFNLDYSGSVEGAQARLDAVFADAPLAATDLAQHSVADYAAMLDRIAELEAELAAR